MSPSQTVSDLLGPLSLGILLASTVFGINCLQFYLYYTRFSQRDSVALKAYVAALMVIDCVHVVLSIATYYHYTVDCFGDPQALQSVYKPLVAQVFVGSLLGTIVRQYFILRIYRLCSRYRTVMSVVLSAISFLELAFSAAYCIVGLRVENFASARILFPYSAVALSSDIACDSLIAAALIYCLYAKRTVFSRTNHAIHLLVMYSLNTCILNTMLALATLVTFILYSQTTIYTATWFVLIRVYTCSMLSTLNSRDNVRQALESQGPLSFSSVELRRTDPELTPHMADATVTKWNSIIEGGRLSHTSDGQ